MKKLILSLVLIVCILSVYAQAPKSFNYQAVARNGSGLPLLNKKVALRVSIHDVWSSGTIYYQERDTATTNQFGLFTIALGQGTALNDSSMDAVKWGINDKYLQVEIDTTAGTNYTNMGAFQLQSVPYALYSANGGTTYAAGNGITINGTTITNAEPDQTVTLTGTGSSVVTGTYPAFNVSSPTSLPPNGAAGGDLSSSYPNPTVNKIQGTTVSNTAPANGQVLKYNGSQWAPSADNNTAYSAGTGIKISANTISNTIDSLGYLNDVSTNGATSGQVLKYNGSLWVPGTDNTGSSSGAVNITPRLSGDGTSINPLDIAQQGASNGQVLKWSNASGAWTPATDNNSGGTVTSVTGNSPISVTNTTTTPVVTLTGVVPVANGGTGTASPAIVAGTGISVNGSFPNQTVSNNGILSVSASGNISSSGGQNPAISFTGTLPVANGGTGATTLNGYLKGNGTSSFTAASSIPGSDVSGNISGNAANVTGVVNIVNGGTGATTANSALNALLPLQASNSGKFLTTNGNNTSWATASGGGVTSVSVTAANGVSGVVTNPTTTPAIAISLGAITPSSVVATGTVTGSNISGTNTGDQTITLSGDVAGSGIGPISTTIGNNVVSYTKLQQMTAYTLIGNPTGGPANAQAINIGSGLSVTGTGPYTLTASGGGGGVTSISASAPIASSGGTTPNISLTGTIPVANGGTGSSSYTTGDMLYASGAAALSKLSDIANGNALISGGIGTTPSWGKIGLTTHVTGTLPVANGGTGATAFTQGSVVFAGASGTYNQNNSQLFWDNTNNRLGIATPSPAFNLDIDGTATNTSVGKFGNSFPVYLGADWPSISFNTYYNGGWKFGKGSSSDYGAFIQMSPATGALSFNSTNSGNADQTATPKTNVTILNNGNVCIGNTTDTTNLTAKLNIVAANCAGNADGGINFLTQVPCWGISGLHLRSDGAGTPRMAILVGGNEVFSVNTYGNMAVTGTICNNGSGVTSCSDIRYKKDIIPLANALDNILQIRGVNYYWRKKEFPDKNFNENKQIGVIAQEVEKVLPELVLTDEKGYKSVDYSKFTPVLIEAIKEQQKMIEELQQSNKQIIESNNQLKAEVEAIKISSASPQAQK